MLETNDIKSKIIDELRTELAAANNLITNIGIDATKMKLHANDDAKEISDLKSRLDQKEKADRIINHDLKNIMSSLIILPDLILAKETPRADQLELLKEIKARSTRMLQLINANIALQKIEAGSYSLMNKRLDLYKILNEIVSQHTRLAEFSKLTFQIDLESIQHKESNAFFVSGDETLVHSILSNLILNAIEASPVGEKIRINLRENDFCEIYIRNRGEVPKEIRKTFFNQYITSGKEHGTGIGTYSAMLMAKALGGDITPDFSEPGATTLILKLQKALTERKPHMP